MLEDTGDGPGAIPKVTTQQSNAPVDPLAQEMDSSTSTTKRPRSPSDAMSGKKVKWPLTKKGVLALYNENLKEEIRMQVIFKNRMDDLWHLRLSDGAHISPIIYVLNKRCNESFGIGAIITIKERIVVQNDPFMPDEKRPRLEDLGLYYIYIKNYKVVATGDVVGNVIGLVNYEYSYRDELKYILPSLAELQPDDDQLRYELQDDDSYNRAKHQSEALRERGNSFFKNGQFSEALSFYCLALKQDGFDCRVWANSSRALFKLENYIEAEVHAVFSIKMNPFYDKGYFRASQAAKATCEDVMPFAAEQYVLDGIFLCSQSTELRDLLKDTNFKIETVSGSIAFDASHFELAGDFVTSAIASTLEKARAQTKGRVIFREIQEVPHKKKSMDLSPDETTGCDWSH